MLWCRFMARQVDIIIVHGLAFLCFNYLSQFYELNPLFVFLSCLVINQALEAVLVYYLNATFGKFLFGLRIYPKTLKDSFKRSYLVYIKALALGFPILGWLFMAISYFQSLNHPPEWDRYGEVIQDPKHLTKGLIWLLVLNITIGVLTYKEYRQQKKVVKSNPDVLETIVIEYEGQAEDDNSIGALWNKACLYGAISFAQIENLQLDINTVNFACKQAGKILINQNDEPEVLYLKACGMGIGIGGQVLYGDELDLKMQGREREILKQVCIPNIDF